MAAQPLESPTRRPDANETNAEVQLQEPSLSDGPELWRLARDSRVLDVNSPYSYALWCRDFADTSVVARDGGVPCGFITGYVQPVVPTRSSCGRSPWTRGTAGRAWPAACSTASPTGSHRAGTGTWRPRSRRTTPPPPRCSPRSPGTAGASSPAARCSARSTSPGGTRARGALQDRPDRRPELTHSTPPSAPRPDLPGGRTWTFSPAWNRKSAATAEVAHGVHHRAGQPHDRRER